MGCVPHWSCVHVQELIDLSSFSRYRDGGHKAVPTFDHKLLAKRFAAVLGTRVPSPTLTRTALRLTLGVCVLSCHS